MTLCGCAGCSVPGPYQPDRCFLDTGIGKVAADAARSSLESDSSTTPVSRGVK